MWDFAQQLPIPQLRIAPSIDPLSDKNELLDPSFVTAIWDKYYLDPSRSILTQISRFDRLEDPLGVIAYRAQMSACARWGWRLGGPGGRSGSERSAEAAAGDPDIHVLLLPPFSDLEINALVCGSGDDSKINLRGLRADSK